VRVWRSTRRRVAVVFLALDLRVVSLPQFLEFLARVFHKVFCTVIEEHDEAKREYAKQCQPEQLREKSHAERSLWLSKKASTLKAGFALPAIRDGTHHRAAMPVPLLDLQLQYQSLKPEIDAAIADVVATQHFILGPKVEAFERELAEFCGVPHAIGMSSGTDALLAILMALEIGPGDAVITTPYSFFATAGSIARVGARPLFVDIDPETYNLSPERLREFIGSDCERREGVLRYKPDGSRIRALMPVHLFGLCCDMNPIQSIAQEYQLPVIEDAAQALSAEYVANGVPVRAGALGDFAAFSFFPSKNLGCFGDGGLVTCRDAEMAERLRSLRNHGMEARYYHRRVGGNFRLDALQAAVLSVKLPRLDDWSAARRRNAATYRESFADLEGRGMVTLPSEPYVHSGAANHHIYNQFVIRARRRDDLCTHLILRGIGHAIYYPVPLHLQDCFQNLGYQKSDFPESERAAEETIALPIFPELTTRQQQEVATALTNFYPG
jgi:dTDP-4-amino-4,6-dideoxygalactose transaminase